ncbi:MAG: type II toxin-antitoxin system RelE/ParE family toxin [Bacteroidetes bacterium]|nr:type II toxin-antitoxin system RelE/ParE family toxin [Bacteroidota bacterium]
MSFEVRTLPEFDQSAKALAKKHASLKHDLQVLVAVLAENPKQGTALGKGCYKVRMSIASKGKGKSGGARVITCVRIVGQEVWLLTIYDKSQRASISDKELKQLVAQIP